MEPSELSEVIRKLEEFSPCDISDALLKLSVPGAGHLPDLIPYSPSPIDNASPHRARLIGPVTPILFANKSDSPAFASNIKPGTHFTDYVPAYAIPLFVQPASQTCAVLGDIVATHLTTNLHCPGIVVAGRVRDVSNLRKAEINVYAKGISTVGAGAEAKPWYVGGDVLIGCIKVKSGDLIVADPVDGVVVIPLEMVGKVLDTIPKLLEQDEKVLEFVKQGGNLGEGFKKFRD